MSGNGSIGPGSGATSAQKNALGARKERAGGAQRPPRRWLLSPRRRAAAVGAGPGAEKLARRWLNCGFFRKTVIVTVTADGRVVGACDGSGKIKRIEGSLGPESGGIWSSRRKTHLGKTGKRLRGAGTARGGFWVRGLDSFFPFFGGGGGGDPTAGGVIIPWEQKSTRPGGLRP